jgi:hypothetical protein
MRISQRIALEYGFWIATLPLLWFLVAWNTLQTWERYGFTIDYFRFYTQEITSCIGAIVMVAFVAWWLRVFPFDRDKWLSLIGAHLLGSFLFSLGHFSIYIVLRIIVYALNDMTYQWQAGALYNFYYEYQKDIGPYLGVVATIWVYTTLVRPQWSESSVDPAQASNMAEGRLIVQTGRGEAILDFREIDYLEAARNYVTIHARSREYLVRDTLRNLNARLVSGPFERCHRSFVVNIDKVAEVRTEESGAHIIELRDGRQLPLGRSYRKAFQARMLTA